MLKENGLRVPAEKINSPQSRVDIILNVPNASKKIGRANYYGKSKGGRKKSINVINIALSYEENEPLMVSLANRKWDSEGWRVRLRCSLCNYFWKQKMGSTCVMPTKTLVWRLARGKENVLQWFREYFSFFFMDVMKK